MRYFFHIAYLGTNYSGWQKHAGTSTIQQVLEDKLSQIFLQKHFVSLLMTGRAATRLLLPVFFSNITSRPRFFVVGKYAFHHPGILQALKEMNHLIGNHTYEHPDLPYYVSVNGDIIDQVFTNRYDHKALRYK